MHYSSLSQYFFDLATTVPTQVKIPNFLVDLYGAVPFLAPTPTHLGAYSFS